MAMDSPMWFQLRDEPPCSEHDFLMSDRLVPSRGTCHASSQLKLDRDESWKPMNEYHKLLSQNILDPVSLTNPKLMSYKDKPNLQSRRKRDSSTLCRKSGESCSPNPKASTSQVVPPVLPRTSKKVLDCPGIVDDFYNHPIDWSASNVIAVALGESVFLYDVSSERTTRLMSLPSGSVTSMRWSPDADGILSVGTVNGEVHLWDTKVQRHLRRMVKHEGRIGALAWHGYMLSSGAADAEVHQHDVRLKDHLVGRLASAHTDLVCGLDYNTDGTLASGGNDNRVNIWASVGAPKPTFTFTEHSGAVKALRWCPWQRNVLASGGGSADCKLSLWNASNGHLLESADTGSQVTGIVWAPEERKLLTGHGYCRNQLSLWDSPSLVKLGDIEGHKSRVLALAQSPDGSVVCSISADQTFRFWEIFNPKSKGEQRSLSSLPPASLLKSIR